MDKREQLMQTLEETFNELHKMQDDEHTLIIVHGDSSNAHVMSTAPHINAMIYLQMTSLVQQLSKVDGPEDVITGLKKETVITLAGMLNIPMDDEFVIKARNTFAEAEAYAKAQMATEVSTKQ